MKALNYITLLALVAVLGGCRKINDGPQQLTDNGTVQLVATIENQTKATPSVDEIAGAFEIGDVVGLFLKPITATDFDVVNKNISFTAAANAQTSAVEFTSANSMKYFTYEKHDVYGYYPYDATGYTTISASDKTKVLPFKVKYDQTGSGVLDAVSTTLTNYTLSDFMWANVGNQVPQVKNSTQTVNLAFNHKMCNIIFVMTNASGLPFKGTVPAVSLSNVERAAQVNLFTGVVLAPATADKGNVVMRSFTDNYEDGVTTSVEYRAICIPQKVDTGAELFRIDIPGSTSFQVIMDANQTFESGKQYRFNVVNKGVNIRLSACEVEDWGKTVKKNGSTGGEGIRPCKMNFAITGADAANAAKVTEAELVISGITYTTKQVSYDPAKQLLTVIYDQGSDWGTQLQSFKLKDKDAGVIATQTGQTLPIYGDPTSGGYDQIITILQLGAIDFIDQMSQPANCYVAHPGGKFMFDITKKPRTLSSATGTNVMTGSDASLSTDLQTGSVKSVGVVWQSAADNATPNPAAAADMIIQNITFSKATGKCLVTPHATGTGNALVAAFGTDGNILWSWHIWVTNGAITAPAATGLADGKNFMDRNLGALAATATQPVVADAYKYFGTLYQWGRKEPFTGQGLGTVANTYTKIFNASAGEITGGLGGFIYNGGAAASMRPCIQNPTIHYSANNVPVNDYGVILGNPHTWSETGNKSIYDPCPYGYRVPKDGSWAGFPAKTWTDGTINEGQLWQSTWWPAAGRRNNDSAALDKAAHEARYWSSSLSATSVGYLLYFDNNNDVDPSYSGSCSYGHSVRCVQE